jgi:hypothetical protein
MRILIVSSFMLFALPAGADVSVSFLDVSRYTDAGRDPIDAERNTAELGKHLEALGHRYLRPDQTLRIEVLDVDLAGRTHLRGGSASDIRVLTGGADWPRMKVRYTLETRGEAPRSAEEDLSDMSYLQNPQRSGESLAYEKRMLDDWFRARFAPRVR